MTVREAIEVIERECGVQSDTLSCAAISLVARIKELEAANVRHDAVTDPPNDIRWVLLYCAPQSEGGRKLTVVARFNIATKSWWGRGGTIVISAGSEWCELPTPPEEQPEVTG